MEKITDTMRALEMKLQALYDIEHEIEKALPKMEKAASDEVLKEGFRVHLDETKEQSKRLEKAFRILGFDVKKTKCEGIRGIVADASAVMKVDASAPIKDAMLAASARYVEHYEMAGYLSAIAEATYLGADEVVDLLRETLREEEATDAKLDTAMSDCLAIADAEGEGA